MKNASENPFRLPPRFTALVSAWVCLVFALSGCKAPKDAEPALRSEAPASESEPDATSAVVVEVDEAVLRKDELEKQVGYALAARNMGDVPPQFLGQDVRDQLSREIIERFIAQNVLLSEAARQNIAAGEEDIAQAIGEISAGLPGGMTLDEALEGYGMTVAQFREDIRKDIRIRKLIDGKTDVVEPATDAEIKEFYDESLEHFQVPANAHTRHILVECEKDASAEKHAEKKSKAESIRKQLMDGADFAKLAGSQSDCPSGKKGGDLGELTRGQTVKEFEDAAFSQPLNETGPVVQTQFGYHIIEALDRTEAHTRPIDEVREDIARFLVDRKKQDVIEQYIQELRSQSTIRYGESYGRKDSGR